MFRTLARHFKQFCTAIVLLLLSALAAEIYLQWHKAPPVATVTPLVDADLQSLLVPSATVHHEMVRLHRPSPDSVTSIVTNSLGLRGDEPVQPKPDGAIRIIFMGDETILGPQLPDTHTVSARLQQLLSSATGQAVEVLNAGVPGYCPLLSWLQYERELQSLQADLVIMHFDMTDVADDALYRRTLKETADRQICVNALLKTDQSPPGLLNRVLQNSALARLLQEETGLAPGSSSGRAGRNLLHRYEWTTATRSDLRLQIQHALEPIQRFGALAEHAGIRILVSTSPVPWQVTSAEEFPTLANDLISVAVWPLTEDLPFRILVAVCERSKLPVCCSTPAFRQFSQPSRLFESDSPQLSAYGAALYAREIATCLLKNDSPGSLFRTATDLSAVPHPQN
ncbi:MAG: SGNH/GDSL hydrolase family protein [Planctomycetaceae bacterium]